MLDRITIAKMIFEKDHSLEVFDDDGYFQWKKDALEVADAILAAQQEREAWQPIETAPKDEAVLCFAEDWEMPIALQFVEFMGRYMWRDWSGDMKQDYSPTHWARWQPLPSLEQEHNND